MPTETPDTGEPETLFCPSCGLKITINYTQLQTSEQIMYVGHVLPSCAAFSDLEDPEEYINAARAGGTNQANDG